MAIIYQKLLLKVGKADMDLKFLYNCKNESVYPKFVRWKHVKDKPFRIRKQLYQKNIRNAIKGKYCRIKELKIELNKALSKIPPHG